MLQGGFMNKRKLGKSGIELSPMGFGSWAVGGEVWSADNVPLGWGKVDDNESIKAMHRAVELGINFFDTADVYGAGHSEIIVGKAMKKLNRDKIITATKFGNVFDEQKKIITGTSVQPDYVKQACENSLRRLDTDYIDLYQLHCPATKEEAEKVIEALEKLKTEGKIRFYGWSTDDTISAKIFAEKDNCVSIQHDLNLFKDADEMIKLCETHNISSINRQPLAMGLLTGKFNKDSRLSKTDIRGNSIDWMMYFDDGKPNENFLNKINAVKEILTSEGRTLVQGAIAWIWGKSDITVPIPGMRNIKQVEENCRSMEFGPLKKEQINDIDTILNTF